MLEATRTAFGGMTAAADRFDAAARRIAGVAPAGADSAPAARLDLSAAAIEVMTARLDFEANAAVARVSARMTKRLLDITA